MPRRAQRRPGAAAAVVAGAALLAGACLPEETPYWVIDHTDALTMQFEVVAGGPFSVPPPPGLGPAVEALPGDRVRATAFVAGPEGPVALSTLRPRWYLCGGAGCGNATLRRLLELPACGAISLPPAEPCALGQADAVEFELGPITNLVEASTRGLRVMMVAGTPEGPTTVECLQRAARLDVEVAPVRDCLFFVRQLRLGPSWLVVLAAELAGAEMPFELSDLPWQASQVETDVAPRIERFTAWVPAPGGGEYFREVEPGGVLSVRTGDEIALALAEGAPPQEYFTYSVKQDSGEVTITPTRETRGAAWFSTAAEAFTPTGGPGHEVLWRAPEAAGTVFVYVVLADGRSATSGWLAVEVAGR